MPFGLKCAAQSFQLLMNTVLQDLDCAFVYLFDILVASSSDQSHFDDLIAVFHRLRYHGLIIKLEKCLFGVSLLDFLGHQVSAASSVPMPSRVSTVKDFPQPRDVKALQEFLGIMYFYHRFIPNLASTLRPPLSSHKHIQTASSSQLDQRNDPSLLCKQTSLGRGNYAGPSLHGLSNRSDMRCIWCGHWRRPGTVRTWSVGTTRIFQSTTA